MTWHLTADTLPPKGEDVLLLWTYPDQAEVQYVRLGRFFMEAFCRNLGTVPLFKIEVDCGDAGSWFYTAKDDAPTHWHALPALPEGGAA